MPNCVARRRDFALIAAAATSSIACPTGEAGPGGAWVASRDTIGDTVVVRTLSGAVGAATHELVPQVSIGVLEGAEEYMLGRVAAIAVAPNGDFYVYDSQIPAIRRYDESGAFLATLGRSGEGPGEYRQITNMEVLADGRLFTWDPQIGRVTVFTDQGSVAGTWQVPGGLYSSRGLAIDSAGHVAVMISLRRGPDEPFRIGFRRHRLDGTLVDTIAPPDWGFEPPTVSASTSREGRRMSMAAPVPFAAQRFSDWSPLGYLVAGVTDRYAVHLLGDESTVLRIGREVPAVPIAAGERQAEEERVIQMMRRLDPGWRWSGPAIPDTKPPLRSVLVADDGRLWVLPSRAAEAVEEEDRNGNLVTQWREPPIWDLFEPDGRYLGEVNVPPRTNLHVMRGDLVWGVQRDSLDVQRVVRFRIEPPLGR